MIVAGLGTDVVEVERIEKAINKTSMFKCKVYTPNEIAYAESKVNKYEVYAGRFACKEAVAKAMGTGVREFSLGDIEILNDPLGKPYIVLGAKLAQKYDSYTFMVSISHSRSCAVATAILLKEE